MNKPSLRTLAICLLVVLSQRVNAIGDQVTLNEIIEILRANEKLYDNVELVMHQVLEMPADRRAKGLEIAVTNGDSRQRIVYQGGMFYQDSKEDTTVVSGKASKRTVLRGYDKEVSRAIFDNKLANVSHDLLFKISQRYKPHVILWSQAMSDGRLVDNPSFSISSLARGPDASWPEQANSSGPSGCDDL